MGRQRRVFADCASPAGRWVVAGVLLIAAAGMVGGCEADRDPLKPLNADEGATLIRGIRKDQSRMQTLTPSERAYLLKTMKK